MGNRTEFNFLTVPRLLSVIGENDTRALLLAVVFVAVVEDIA